MKNYYRSFLLIFLLLFSCIENSHKTSNKQGVIAHHGMVVSAHPLASRVGVEILKKGGNAIDAAIAVQFALAVVLPWAGNIGGGGFMVIRNSDGEIAALDYREKAPLSGGRNMYLDSLGNVVEEASTHGHLAVGVPGSVAGMVEAHEKFGHLSWADLVQPAINLAKNGFVLTEQEAQNLNEAREDFIQYNTIKPEFLLRSENWQSGDTIVMTDLAHTLERIRDHQKAGFYQGETARLLLEEMQRGHGLITQQDLAQYKAIWRQPVVGHFKSYRDHLHATSIQRRSCPWSSY